METWLEVRKQQVMINIIEEGGDSSAGVAPLLSTLSLMPGRCKSCLMQPLQCCRLFYTELLAWVEPGQVVRSLAATGHKDRTGADVTHHQCPGSEDCTSCAELIFRLFQGWWMYVWPHLQFGML